MKRKHLLTTIMLVIILAILSTTNVSSKIQFPVPGVCGDPTSQPIPDLTCSNTALAGQGTPCHGGSNQAVTSSNLLLQIGTDSNSLSLLNSSFNYVPGTNYFVSFSVIAPGWVSGFELTALNPSNSMAGSFATTNTTEHLSGSATTSYISHRNAAHGVNTWVFQWAAPATDSAVTFYYAFNSSDSVDYYLVDTAVSGVGVPDSNIFAGTTTIHASSSGINNIYNSISSLMVYPNPTSSLFNLSFAVNKPGATSASLYSVDGKLCQQLFNENLNTGSFNRSFDVSSFAAGIYFVKLNIDGATVTKKIVIQ
jgi:hypothetical protein